MLKKEWLTPHQVSKALKISLSTVLTRFANLPGVIDIGPGKKRRILRIPRSVLSKFLQERRVR